MSKNHPNIYTKLPDGGYGNKHRDLALPGALALLKT